MSAPVRELSGPTAFDLAAKLAAYDPGALSSSADYRRAVTRADPLMFALVYLSHHLRDDSTGNRVTFSEFHLDLFEQAKQWMRTSSKPMQDRDCYVAPRGAGKSTLCFLLLPMWSAAHGHIKFIAAFADSASQAELHLQSFKRELDDNPLLRADFPELCSPAKRPKGQSVSDSRGMMVCQSGFVFGARGMDGSSLGMKVGNRRPDLLLLDDVEPDESNYSAYQKGQRLSTLQDAILPLSLYARVVLVGTVVMHGSIVHDLVRTVTEAVPPETWPAEENFRTHYFAAIVTDPETGKERSLWPGKWSLEFLQSIRHTRSFKKNYMNLPVPTDGAYWSEEDFRYGSPEDPTRWILSIDPATTSKTASDYTGIGLVGFDRTSAQCVVSGAWAVKLTPAALRARVLSLLELNPSVKAVLIETNQGGDTWAEILSPMPPGVKLLTVHQSEPKHVRAARVLDYYQSGWVFHARPIQALEEQLCSFPSALSDDLVDAVGSGIHFFLQNRKKPLRREEVSSYV